MLKSGYWSVALKSSLVTTFQEGHITLRKEENKVSIATLLGHTVSMQSY